MKTILKSLLVALIGSTLLSANAQDSRKLDYFDAITVTGDVEVTLVRGDEPGLAILTEGVDDDDVSIFVKGKTLKIQMIEGLFRDLDRVEVIVTYTKLRGIKSSAGAEVRSEGVVEGDELQLKASSGGRLTLEVQSNSIEATVSEGAGLTIAGNTEDQEITASTGGIYDARELQSQRTYAKATTGGEASVVANHRLDANASTGGIIRYSGEPEFKNTRSVIAGEIHQL